MAKKKSEIGGTALDCEKRVIGTVEIVRYVQDWGDGKKGAPLFLKMQAADFQLGRGRKGNVSTNVAGGDLIVTFEKTDVDDERCYVVTARSLIEAIIIAEGIAS